MSFRSYIEKLDNEKTLLKIGEGVSKKLEASGILKELNEKPILFEKINESDLRVAGNVFSTKKSIADYFGVTVNDLIPKIINAIENPSKPKKIENAPCQEVEIEADLDKLPLLLHCENDGGNYISSGICIITDSEFGQNVDFHRCMQFDRKKMAVRIVKTRHFDQFLEKQKEMNVAICVGNSPNVLLAAASSVEKGVNELEIANTLEPLEVVKAKTFDALIPADCEIVIEGIIRLEEKHDEGPFVDLTETSDVVRQEPVFEAVKITHRKNAIWQALLPGALEHKILMGMPREPTIFKKVNDSGIKCLDVNISPGGASWLHAIVQIDKKNEDDGKKAIQATFEGHKSCKHVFAVDEDIDIYDPLSVEWAMATRFQANVDLIVKDRERGSSLDPSAEPGTNNTTKVGFDLTKPLVVKGKNFEKAEFPKVDLKKYGLVE